MRRRIAGSGRFAALAALLTLAAAAPASANQWFIEDGPHGHRHRIPPGASVDVPTEGEFYLKLRITARRAAMKATCRVSGTEVLSNPTGKEALAQTSAPAFYSCDSDVTATPVLMPWSGTLAGNCQPCTITFPVSLEVSVEGTDYGVFSGMLRGRIGDFDPPVKDDIDHAFKWMGKHGGTLVGESGTVNVAGGESFGSKARGDLACGEPNAAPAQEEESNAEARRHDDDD